jgi:hypothetical protein
MKPYVVGARVAGCEADPLLHITLAHLGDLDELEVFRRREAIDDILVHQKGYEPRFFCHGHYELIGANGDIPAIQCKLVSLDADRAWTAFHEKYARGDKKPKHPQYHLPVADHAVRVWAHERMRTHALAPFHCWQVFLARADQRHDPAYTWTIGTQK